VHDISGERCGVFPPGDSHPAGLATDKKKKKEKKKEKKDTCGAQEEIQINEGERIVVHASYCYLQVFFFDRIF
jgi:hypothetical protein